MPCYFLVSAIKNCERVLTVDASPCRIDRHAISKATKLLEQAVSIVRLGPVKLKNVLIRFESMLPAVPAAEYLGPYSGSLIDASK